MTEATDTRPVATRGAPQAQSGRLALWGVVVLLALIAAQVYGLLESPPDRDMGHLQKIMYVHVPSAWSAFVAFLVVFVASIAYLWTGRARHDLIAASAAEVGALLTALTLALGSIWGRPTWGVWWTWDPRLTSTAVLLVVFVGYLALRAFTDDFERRARWSAVVGILGFLNVPVVYLSVRWWRTIHQVQSAPSTVDTTFAWGLRVNAVAFLLLMIYFVRERYRVASMEHLLEATIEERELRGSHGV
ncbi:MAG TPA: cytochrome c biogenesis protein CcsA [Longimicrobiales bacterium]|nr:cytochrome c biogenesis protein CcsA [Longimicrobiales bacterium]